MSVDEALRILGTGRASAVEQRKAADVLESLIVAQLMEMRALRDRLDAYGMLHAEGI